MRASFWAALLGAGAAAGLAAGALAALAGFDAGLLWPSGASALALLVGLGVLWSLAWSLAGVLALRLPWTDGAIAAWSGSLWFLLAPAWPKILRISLPAPHDLPERKLQIFLAGLFIAALATTVLGLLLRASRAARWSLLTPRQWALRLGALAWGVYLLSGLWTWRWHMTGDAPIYALLAAGVAHDHSLDVQPGFSRHEWKRFYDLDRELEPQDPPQAGGTRYVEHRPFEAFTMAPCYALAGVGGLIWMESLFAAITAGLFYAVLRTRRFSPDEALLGFGLFAFGASWWTYSVNLHIEVLGGALAWAWLCTWTEVLPAALAWALPGALVWTALRFNPSAGLFSAASAWIQRSRPWKAALHLGLFAAAAGAYAWLSKEHFGSVSPMAQYASQDHNVQEIVHPLGFFTHFCGVLLDQEYGMLTYSPALILAFAGAVFVCRRRDPLCWPLGLWVLPYGGMICATAWWYGAQNPDRYIIFLVPALTYLAMEGWRGFRFRSWTWGLALWGWLGALLLQVLPWFSYSKKDGAAWPLKIAGKALHHDLAGYFPSYMEPPNHAAPYWSAALCAILALLLFRAWRAAPPSQP